MDNLYVGNFLEFVWKMFFLGILSIQSKIRRDRPSDTRRFQRLG